MHARTLTSNSGMKSFMSLGIFISYILLQEAPVCRILLQNMEDNFAIYVKQQKQKLVDV